MLDMMEIAEVGLKLSAIVVDGDRALPELSVPPRDPRLCRPCGKGGKGILQIGRPRLEEKRDAMGSRDRRSRTTRFMQNIVAADKLRWRKREQVLRVGMTKEETELVFVVANGM